MCKYIIGICWKRYDPSINCNKYCKRNGQKKYGGYCWQHFNKKQTKFVILD